VPTASEFNFRLIVHVDTNGVAQLLQKVLILWKEGRYRTNDAGMREVAVSGHYVLLTDEMTSQAGLTGAALLDGELAGRRISSTAFGFRQPLLMTDSSGGFGAGAVSCLVTTAMMIRLIRTNTATILITITRMNIMSTSCPPAWSHLRQSGR
jgi:hypothetical protein